MITLPTNFKNSYPEYLQNDYKSRSRFYITTHKNKVFHAGFPQETADLVTFTEDTLNGKLHFLCSVT